jgi:hypothetical protein
MSDRVCRVLFSTRVFAFVFLQRIHHRRHDRDSLRDALIAFHAAQRQSSAHKSKQQHQQRHQPNSTDRASDEAASAMVGVEIPFRFVVLSKNHQSMSSHAPSCSVSIFIV